MRAHEAKVLAAVREHPGMLWYEVGAIVYPGSTRARVNILGKPFRELCGRGLSLTHDAFVALERDGRIERDGEFRYRIPAEKAVARG